MTCSTNRGSTRSTRRCGRQPGGRRRHPLGHPRDAARRAAAFQEYFGYWLPEVSAAAAIPTEAWRSARWKSRPKPVKLAFGVKFSRTGEPSPCRGRSAEPGGGSYAELCEVAGTSSGTAWLSDMLIRNADEIAVCVVDGRSGAALVQRLLDGGFPRQPCRRGSPAKASGGLDAHGGGPGRNAVAHRVAGAGRVGH
ncbi:MAG: hypothetical protein ACLR3C_06865 [Eggerthella lenta]